MTDTPTSDSTIPNAKEYSAVFPDLATKDEQTPFTIYDATTGKIGVVGFAPASMTKLQPRATHEGLICQQLNQIDHYVDVSTDTHVGAVRPDFPGFDKTTIKADGVDAATMSLDVAATVIIDGAPYEAEPGPLVFTADTPGSYSVEIDEHPYKPFTTTIVAQ